MSPRRMGDSAIDVFAFESPRRPNLFGSRWKEGRISRKASKVLKKIEREGKILMKESLLWNRLARCLLAAMRLTVTKYLLTPWSIVLLEKLTGFAASQKNSPHFMEPESSLPYSQVPATCPNPE